MNKILFFISVLFISLILVACKDDQKTYTYEEVLASIEIGYAEGDHIDHVTQNITLPFISSLDKKATLSWESSNISILQTNGTVNRPLSDTEVILILSLRVGSIARQEIFVLTIKGSQVFYTVTFDIEGETETQSILEGLTVNEPLDIPEKENHIFIGWFVNDAAYNFSTPIMSNITIVAAFELIQNTDYAIEFYEQRTTDGSYQRLSNEVLSGTPGQTVTINRSKEGFVINAELSILSGTITISAPLILKVYYDRILYDVSFKHEGELIETIKVKFGADILPIDAPNLDMHTFVGWFFDEELTIPLSSQPQANQHTTLYAKYELQTEGSYLVNVYHENLNNDLYTLISSTTFQTAFGSLAVYEQSYIGFALNEELSNVEGVLEYESPLVLNIYYLRIRYEVVFVDDDIVFETTVKHNGLIIPIADLEKDGYEFIGWTRTFNSTVLYDFSAIVDSEVILYAVWNDLNIPIYEGYYESLNGVINSMLKGQLRTILSTGFLPVSYGDARYILDDTDRDPNNPSNLIVVYRGTSVPGVWDDGITWNREHVWPQSLLGVSVTNTSKNVGSDLHNLKPANPSENSSRGNRYFDWVAIGGISYTPREAVRGDVARILLYMDTMYSNLTLVNVVGTNEPAIYQMAQLNTLLQWHIDDPVDDFERNRNEVIYSYQRNRNPFIDHPELVERIWGQVTLSSGESVQLEFYDETYFIEIRIDLYDIPSNRKKEEYQM